MQWPDQYRVMHRGTRLDAALGGKTAGEPQHLRAVCLHRKVAERSGVGVRGYLDPPAKDRVDAALQHGVIQHLIGPAPEGAISVVMELQQFARPDRRLADALGESFRAHSVLDSENARLELFAYSLVRLLCRVFRYCTGLL